MIFRGLEEVAFLRVRREEGCPTCCFRVCPSKGSNLSFAPEPPRRLRLLQAVTIASGHDRFVFFRL